MISPHRRPWRYSPSSLAMVGIELARLDVGCHGHTALTVVDMQSAGFRVCPHGHTALAVVVAERAAFSLVRTAIPRWLWLSLSAPAFTLLRILIPWVVVFVCVVIVFSPHPNMRRSGEFRSRGAKIIIGRRRGRASGFRASQYPTGPSARAAAPIGVSLATLFQPHTGMFPIPEFAVERSHTAITVRDRIHLPRAARLRQHRFHQLHRPPAGLNCGALAARMREPAPSSDRR